MKKYLITFSLIFFLPISLIGSESNPVDFDNALPRPVVNQLMRFEIKGVQQPKFQVNQIAHLGMIEVGQEDLENSKAAFPHAVKMSNDLECYLLDNRVLKFSGEILTPNFVLAALCDLRQKVDEPLCWLLKNSIFSGCGVSRSK